MTRAKEPKHAAAFPRGTPQEKPASGVAVREASDYDDAVKLAVDLRDLSTRDRQAADFAERFEAMRKRQQRRRGFFDRWKVAESRV